MYTVHKYIYWKDRNTCHCQLLPIYTKNEVHTSSAAYIHTSIQTEFQHNDTMVQWHSQNSSFFLLLWLLPFTEARATATKTTTTTTTATTSKVAKGTKIVCRQLFIYLSNYFMGTSVRGCTERNTMNTLLSKTCNRDRACGCSNKRTRVRDIPINALMLLCENDIQTGLRKW